jgi:hypothetical protein
VGAVLRAAALFGTTGTAQALGPAATTPLGVGAARLVIGGLALLSAMTCSTIACARCAFSASSIGRGCW